jgi:putative ABC transport system ATP-binding protein
MNNNTDFIQLKQLTKSYGTAGNSFEALKDINLKINQGEYVIIVGKSGSGKSTLLNMLTGIDHPSNGTVTINNTGVHTLAESNLATWRGKNIGIVFQFFQLIPTLSILENMLLAMDFVNAIPKNERKTRAENILDQVGLTQHKNKLPSALSGGEQQRAAIARALSNDPPILVADEPSGNLDSKTTKEIFALFSQLVNDGKTIILVTHEAMNNIECDRIITLNDGTLISDKPGRNHE